MRTTWIAWLAIAAALSAVHAVAIELDPRAAVAVTYSDNLQRSSSDELKGAIADALIGVRVLHASPWLDIDGDVRDLHREFLHRTLASENLPSGYLNLIGNIVPQRLAWTAQDNVGQVSSQLLDALDTADRQTINVLSTGPDLLLPLPGRNHLNLNGRYGTSSYSRSNIDSRRYDAGLALSHELLRTASLSLNYVYRRINYKEDRLYPSNTVAVAFLGYSVETFRTYLVAEIGAESLRVGAAGERSNTPHIRLALQRRLSPWWTLNVEYGRGFSDTAGNFRSDSRDNFRTGSSQNVQVVASSFKSDQAYVMLLRSGGRTLAAWEVTWSKESYDTAPALNRHITGADLVLDYRLSPQLTLAARGRWTREQAAMLGRSVSGFEASVGLNEQLTRRLQVAIRVLHGGGAMGVTSQRFREKRATLAISYTSRPSRRERLFDPGAQFRLYERPVREQAMQDSAGPRAYP
jgi:hypothetical protein